MDKKFSVNDKVEALGTETRVWRNAVVQVISARSVSLPFPGFPEHMTRLVVDITGDVQAQKYSSQWPIRFPRLEIQQNRRKRHASHLSWSYRPETRVKFDAVYTAGDDENTTVKLVYSYK